MQSKEPTTLETLAANLEKLTANLETLTGNVAQFRHEVTERLDKLEGDQKETNIRLESYQRGLDGMVRMATTIVVTTGAVVILGNLSPALLTLVREFSNLATQ